MHPRLRPWLDALAAALLAVTVAGSWGAWHWLLDLTSHFRWYWLLAAAAGVVLAARRPWSPALACSGLALVGNAWAMLPFWLAPPAATTPVGVVARTGEALSSLSLVSCNLHREHPDKPRAVAYLRASQPDIAVLLEVDADWAAQLSGLDDLYPFRLVAPREDGFGLAILSRLPLSDPRLIDVDGTSDPIGTATVRCHGRDVRLFVTHPGSPLSVARWTSLVAQLRVLADAAAGTPGTCIVAGDFNTTPWSLAYRAFVARSGLRDTALGRGVQATWNARLPAPRIPIDHVFASPDLAVVRRAVGPDVGSDHFPVEATFVLPPAD